MKIRGVKCSGLQRYVLEKTEKRLERSIPGMIMGDECLLITKRKKHGIATMYDN